MIGSKELAILATGVFVVAAPTWGAVRRRYRADPARRVWFVLGAIAGLVAVVWYWPRVGKLSPPWSESPSGLLIVIPQLIGTGAVTVASLTTLVAVFVPLGAPPPEP